MGVVIAGAVLGWWLLHDASSRDPLAGATFKRLTDWDAAEEQVAISRDGKFVAFISDRSGTWDAWVGQIGADCAIPSVAALASRRMARSSRYGFV